MLKRTLVAGVTVAALAVGGVVAAETANAGPSTTVAPRTAAGTTNTAVVPAGSASMVTPYVTYPGSVPTLTAMRVLPRVVRSGHRVWVHVVILRPRGYPIPTGSILVRVGRWTARVTLVHGAAWVLIVPKLYVQRHQRIRFFPITATYLPARHSIFRSSSHKVYAIVVR